MYIFNVSFVYASSCVDLKINLVKKNKGNNVLLLQNFLYDSGYLKALPNGYFGEGTFKAVVNYQRDLGYTPSGKVFALTRAAIKKETCNNKNTDTVSAQPKSNTPAVNINEPVFCTTEVTRCSDGSYVGRTGPKCEFLACPKNNQSVSVATTSKVTTADDYPLPYINSIDRTYYFENSITDKGFTLTGNNFGTTSNDIYVVSKMGGLKYFVGSFKKTTETTLYASSSLSSDYFSCGTNCSRRLAPGIYDLYIDRKGSYNNIISFNIKNFRITPTSGSESSAILGMSTSTKIGSIQFSGLASFSFDTLSVDFREDTTGLTTIRKTHFSNFVFKDSSTGEKITTSINVNEGQTKSIDIYADINTQQNSGSIYAIFGFNVVDSVYKTKSKAYSPEVLLTVTAY